MRIKKTSQTTVLQNEIAVDYSIDETKTGYNWIDGKPIYRKVIDFGNLPNTTSKTVAHNISNIDKIITLTGTATDGTRTLCLPANSPDGLAYSINLYTPNLTNITVGTGVDRSTYSAYIVLEYTKTTD